MIAYPKRRSRKNAQAVLDTGRRSLLGAALAISAQAIFDKPVYANVSEDEALQASRLLDERHLPGFRQRFVKVDGSEILGHAAEGAIINVLAAGEGPPLLLIHGYPENHLCWRKIAPKLVSKYTVVLPDLRGYGRSSKPGTSIDHVNYAKTTMAADLIQVMKAFGFDRFQAVGHDRGARVLQAMLMDHPETVTRGVLLDVIPTDLMYSKMDAHLAEKYFWWLFHIQQSPLPENFIGALPDYYVRSHFAIQNKTAGSVEEDILQDYIQTCSGPEAIHAACEDFRAAAGVDSRALEAARTSGRKLTQPLLVVWGSEGTIGQSFDMLAPWKEEAADVRGAALPCGHLIHEEDPEGLLALIENFLERG